ncbi:Hydrogenase 2 maturation protease [compost metagenome]
MKRILVLGIGNRLMRDDGIGVYVVETLQKEDQFGDVQYLVGETDIDYCLRVLEDVDRLIIVDAVKSDREVGEVSCHPIEEIASFHLGISIHELHLFSIIPVMYPLLHVTVIGIDVESVDFGLGLSQALELQFSRVVHDVRRMVYILSNEQNK